MLIPNIYIAGEFIQPYHIKEFHLNASLDCLFLKGALKIGMYPPTKGKLGDWLTVRFLDDPDARRSVYELNFRVDSIEREAGEGKAAPTVCSITFVHEWIYNQSPITLGYFGSVSAILKEALQNESVETGGIETSSDEARVRYRIFEGIPPFLDRIKKYALQDTSDMYMYMDIDGKINLMSSDTIKHQSPVVQVTPFFLDEELDGEPEDLGIPVQQLMGFKIYNSRDNAATHTDILFTTSHLNEEELEVVNTSMGMTSKEEDFEHICSPFNNHKAHIYSWNMSSAEALAVAINTTKDVKLEAIAIVRPHKNLSLGKTIDIFAGKKYKAINGTYYIHNLLYMFHEGNGAYRLDLARAAHEE